MTDSLNSGAGVAAAVTDKPRKRHQRHWSEEEKQRIIEATLQPGASVSKIAAEHNVRAGQVYEWRRRHLGKQKPRRKAHAVKLLPVAVSELGVGKSTEPVHGAAGVIEIEMRKGRVRIVGIDTALLRVALEMLQ